MKTTKIQNHNVYFTVFSYQQYALEIRVRTFSHMLCFISVFFFFFLFILTYQKLFLFPQKYLSVYILKYIYNFLIIDLSFTRSHLFCLLSTSQYENKTTTTKNKVIRRRKRTEKRNVNKLLVERTSHLFSETYSTPFCVLFSPQLMTYNIKVYKLHIEFNQLRIKV